jgi:hypothetical protein
MPNRARALGAGLLLAASALGCQQMNTPLYFNGTMPLEVMGTPGMEARLKDGVALRFRNPTDKESQERQARENAAGYKVSWITRDNVHIELLYTVTNLDDTPGRFNVMVDGANQYIKYDEDVVAAAIAQGNDDPIYLPLMESGHQILDAGQTYHGTMREDDFAEAESDINAIDQFAAPFASVVINRSDVNPVGMEMVPPGAVVPALLEVDVTFSADRHMVCEYLVRVRDDDDQLLHDKGDTRFGADPKVFTPTLPANP